MTWTLGETINPSCDGEPSKQRSSSDRRPSEFYAAGMARSNFAFAEQVHEVLLQGGYRTEVEPTVGGFTPDFAVHLSNNQVALVEAKSWHPTAANLDRALAERRFMQERLGAVEAVIVLPGVPEAVAADGIVALDRLLEYLAEREGWRHKGSVTPASVEDPKPIMFCAMPFDSAYDDVFFVAMLGAATKVGLTARRVDQDEFSDDIVERILTLIEQSAVVVADLSEAKPNVMYEVGYARGVEKPVVAISSSPLTDLPFDVAHNNTLAYSKGQTHQLVERLAARVAAVSA